MRRLKLSLVAAFCCALLMAGGASALGAFLVDKPNQFVLACDAARCDFWLVLDEGYADQISLTVGDDTLYAEPRWSLRLPEARYMRWWEKQHDHVCELKELKNFFYPYNGARSVQCLTHGDVHLRLGDLNDTFVASSLDLSTAMYVLGEDGADYIRSARAKDRLSGGNGNDVLRSAAGADSLFGEADNDLLDGGDGADLLDCGDGDDTIQYQGRVSALNITLDGVANDGASGENDKIEANCENVEAWNGADKVVGSTVVNRLYGRDGNDTLKGGGSNDRLYGGNDRDSLFGEAGNDSLNGDAGDDTIDGGTGTDTIYGGAGNDTINVKDGQKDTVYCGAGDYDVVTHDAIDEIDIGTCERR